MSDGGVNLGGTGLKAGGCRADERASGRTEIVDDNDGAPGGVAHERTAGDLIQDASLFHEQQLDRTAGQAFELLAEDLSALDAAHVGRGDGERPLRKPLGEVSGHHGQRAQVIDGNAEGVVQGRRVVHVERNQSVRAGCLEERGHVARVDRIPQLRPAVLAREGEIGDDREAALGAAVPQHGEQKAQPQEAVRDGRVRRAGQGLHHEDIPIPHRLQRPQLELAALEAPLFDGRHGQPGRLADAEPEIAARGQDDHAGIGSRALADLRCFGHDGDFLSR